MKGELLPWLTTRGPPFSRHLAPAPCNTSLEYDEMQAVVITDSSLHCPVFKCGPGPDITQGLAHATAQSH